jgi:hypothetical protein
LGGRLHHGSDPGDMTSEKFANHRHHGVSSARTLVRFGGARVLSRGKPVTADIQHRDHTSKTPMLRGWLLAATMASTMLAPARAFAPSASLTALARRGALRAVSQKPSAGRVGAQQRRTITSPSMVATASKPATITGPAPSPIRI